MVKSKLRYYTYKITFKDLPKYFYYGKRKDTGKPYFGSPKTWRHLWEQFEPEVQILQWYETEKEVKEAEDALIEHTWKQQWGDRRYSLNENKGGLISEESCREGGKKGGSKNTEQQRSSRSRTGKRKIENLLSHPNTKENQSQNGRVGFLEKKGAHDPEVQKRIVEGKLGAMSLEVKSENGKRSSVKTNSQVWRCTVTKKESNSGGLTMYQRKMGIDTSNRERVK